MTATATKAVAAISPDELVEQIQDCHRDVQRNLRTAVQRALDAGDLFHQAFQGLQFGQRSQFIESTGIPRRTAYFYMELAANRDLIEVECATVAQLSVRGAKRVINEAKKEEQSQHCVEDTDPRDAEEKIEAEAQELLDRYRSASCEAQTRFLELARLTKAA